MQWQHRPIERGLAGGVCHLEKQRQKEGGVDHGQATPDVAPDRRLSVALLLRLRQLGVREHEATQEEKELRPTCHPCRIALVAGLLVVHVVADDLDGGDPPGGVQGLQARGTALSSAGPRARREGVHPLREGICPHPAPRGDRLLADVIGDVIVARGAAAALALSDGAVRRRGGAPAVAILQLPRRELLGDLVHRRHSAGGGGSGFRHLSHAGSERS
mmetsp:Transcript_125842/g.364094  ORF Transcript_125842/g.364094 Transcript_125842/m.364094 type:complete len:217 (-) Transcript_125842:24-674(-)